MNLEIKEAFIKIVTCFKHSVAPNLDQRAAYVYC